MRRAHRVGPGQLWLVACWGRHWLLVVLAASDSYWHKDLQGCRPSGAKKTFRLTASTSCTICAVWLP